MARISVVGREETIDAAVDTTVLAALQAAQAPISTSCGGQGKCGFCRLTVTSGKDLLSPANAKEIGHLGNVCKLVNIRLACQATVVADGEIELDIPTVVDIAARKREQARRGLAERASRRRNPTGSDDSPVPNDNRDPKNPAKKIEWRPSKLNPKEDDGSRRASGGDASDGNRRRR
ncbi:MAG: (2Fe-2S)-binding protein [Polyangiaceae bacterium]|nr:(2Fe-2S)-binding protein [Polyangiaceae bacterium]